MQPRFVREIRQRRRAVKPLAAAERMVISYSAGKSGSTAVSAMLERAGICSPHIHTLRRDGVIERLAEHRATRGTPMKHVWQSQWLVDHPRTPDDPWTVITTVREPIALDVAAYFQTAERHGRGLHPDPEDVLRDRGLTWFDEEVLPALGIDVYETEFDPSQGWQRYSGDDVELLVIRQESLAAEPISAFLGEEVGPLTRANVSSEKRYGDTYRAFLDAVRFAPALVDQHYASKFAQHFYSDDERAAFARRWTEGVPVSRG